MAFNGFFFFTVLETWGALQRHLQCTPCISPPPPYRGQVGKLSLPPQQCNPGGCIASVAPPPCRSFGSPGLRQWFSNSTVLAGVGEIAGHRSGLSLPQCPFVFRSPVEPSAGLPLRIKGLEMIVTHFLVKLRNWKWVTILWGFFSF